MLAIWPRTRVPEIMDQPGLPASRHETALRGLARINFLSASAGILWRPLAADIQQCRDRPYRVLDIACGGGDVTIRLWQHAQRRGMKVQIDACDVSETAIRFASRQSEIAGAEIRFFRLDVFQDPILDEYDAVVCSLFLHHLDDEEAIELLRVMAAASKSLVLVNDLARSRRGYWLARFATKLFTRSDVVRFDGPVSVLAAYTPEEALALADRAGLAAATVDRRWPCRFLLTWKRKDDSR
jgi:2-polyprenyl-3-methyl-5-hydroxy-6-metoxy-1,4-benzoquinol methylase